MAEYFTGDNVPLKFKVTDAEGNVNPSAVNVIIRKPHTMALTEPIPAGVDGNTVSYLVPTSVTTNVGEYHAFFVCELPYGIRTYQMNFSVLSNPR